VEEFDGEVPSIRHRVRAPVAVDGGGGARRWEAIVSTAHRARGREWRSVRLAADWSWLRLVADDGWANHEEANVAYVAVTRAIEALDPAALEEALSRERQEGERWMRTR
jgi:superfamily I DNA/RNA helicase